MTKRRRKKAINGKGRLNLRVPLELDEFIKGYAQKKNTTVTQIVIDHFTELKEQEINGHVPQC